MRAKRQKGGSVEPKEPHPGSATEPVYIQMKTWVLFALPLLVTRVRIALTFNILVSPCEVKYKTPDRNVPPTITNFLSLVLPLGKKLSTQLCS